MIHVEVVDGRSLLNMNQFYYVWIAFQSSKILETTK